MVIFQRCYAANQTCALWRSSDTSPIAIRERVERVLVKIRAHPVPVYSHGSTDLITYAESSLLYIAPVSAFTCIFLNAIHEGSVSDHLPWLKMGISCSAANSSTWPDESSYDTMITTTCGDAESLATTPLAEFEDYLSLLRSQSPTAGPPASESRLPCMAWPSSLRPKWRFAGPFGTRSNNNTQTPILFLNNRLDPVCPIRMHV